METRNERLTRISKQMGTRHQRKLRRYSNGFNEVFNFFLMSYRHGILTFTGSLIEIKYNKDSQDSKESFRMFEDGQFKGKTIETRHPNILFAVISGKKSWGLWVDQWTDGIVDFTFTKQEILSQFEEKGIKIPFPFMKEFDNMVWRKKLKLYDEILSQLEKSNT